MNFEFIRIGKDIIFTSLVNIIEAIGCRVSSQVSPGVFLYQDIKEEHTRRRFFPDYKSWRGHDGWVETVIKHFDITYGQARIAMLNPRDDFDWVLKLSEDEVRLILGEVTPFNYAYFNSDIWKFWSEKISKTNIHFRRFVMNAERMMRWNSRSYGHFKAQLATDNHPLLDHIKWWEMNGSELDSIKRFGFASKYLDGIPEECPDPLLIHRVSSREKKPGYELTLKDMVNFGITHQQLLPEYTKAERARLWKDWPDEKMAVFHTFSFYLKIMGVDGQVFNHCLESHKSHPGLSWDEWRIFAKWIIRKKEKLNKTRVVHGPAGQSATIYYRELVRHISPKMLVKGEKTSWETVQDQIQAEIQRRINEQLGVDQPFPVNKYLETVLKKFPNAKTVKTTHALKYEGEIMDHCVGGYIHSVMNQQTYILHLGLEAPDGATLEISPDGNGVWKKHQCFAYHDATPIPSLMEMADKIVVELNKKGGERK